VHVALDSLPPRDTELRTVIAPAMTRIDLFADTALATSVPLATPTAVPG
jgi:hypothetical protein